MFSSFIKKLFVSLLILGVIYTMYYFAFRNDGEEFSVVVSNFEECMLAGFPIMESYPRQCASPAGTFVEDIGNELDKTNE